MKGAARWTWEIQIQDVADLIPACGLVLTKGGKLSSDSVKILNAIKPKAVLRKF